jgi:hypothetical protein
MRIAALSPALLIGVSVAACTGYQTLADPAADLQASPSPVTRARVTLRSGERLELNSPCVSGDSLMGFSVDGGPRHVALADVTKVQVPKTGKSGTAEFVDAMVLANSDMWTRRTSSGGCPPGGG